MKKNNLCQKCLIELGEMPDEEKNKFFEQFK